MSSVLDFQKKTTVLIVISKPPLEWHENFLLHKRFFLFHIVCGRTDMRKSIDGLCAIIQEQFSMEIDHALFLFCGRKCDRIKAILKEPDGIVMIYKRLTAQGSYRWPRNKSEVRNLTWREFDWLMSGIDIEQPKAIKAT